MIRVWAAIIKMSKLQHINLIVIKIHGIIYGIAQA